MLLCSQFPSTHNNIIINNRTLVCTHNNIIINNRLPQKQTETKTSTTGHTREGMFLVGCCSKCPLFQLKALLEKNPREQQSWTAGDHFWSVFLDGYWRDTNRSLQSPRSILLNSRPIALFCACCLCSDEDCRIAVETSAFFLTKLSVGIKDIYFVTTTGHSSLVMNNATRSSLS